MVKFHTFFARLNANIIHFFSVSSVLVLFLIQLLSAHFILKTLNYLNYGFVYAKSAITTV